VKFIKNKEPTLEFESISPQEILVKAIMEKPVIETREDYSWRIGNVKNVNNQFGSFAVGRTMVTAIPHYDSKSKDFMEEVSQTDPFTTVYFDTTLGLLGIKRNYQLSPTESSVANRIEELFASTNIVINTFSYVEIDSVKDPVSFINKLKTSYAIKKFTVTFGGPNPFDADEHFHKPMSIYLQSAHGKDGKTTIDGENLNQDVLIRMTQSVASTGNNAIARLQNTPDEKVVSVSLRDNPAKIIISPDLTDEVEIHDKILTEYTKIRRGEA
jgi:hypothetical protein